MIVTVLVAAVGIVSSKHNHNSPWRSANVDMSRLEPSHVMGLGGLGGGGIHRPSSLSLCGRSVRSVDERASDLAQLSVHRLA